MNAVEETRMIGQILERLLPQMNAQAQELTKEQRRLIMHVCIGVLAEMRKEKFMDIKVTYHGSERIPDPGNPPCKECGKPSTRFVPPILPTGLLTDTLTIPFEDYCFCDLHPTMPIFITGE